MSSMILKLVLACTAALMSLQAAAQAKYPDKPVKLIVPWTAGGGVDVLARALAAGLTPAMKQPVLVENKTGASGMIGAEFAANSAPDGYTLFVANVDTHVINPQLFPAIRYKAVEGFDPIVEVAKVPLVVAIRGDLGVKNGQDLIKLAKSKPGQVTYGTWGIGSLPHIAFTMMEQQAGIQLLHVPYQGVAGAMGALLAKQIDMLLVPVPWAEGQRKVGKAEILGLTSEKRAAAFPDVPTIAEQGFTGFAAEQWIGLYAPKGTPAAVRDALNKEVNDYLKTPAGIAAIKDLGFEASGGTARQMADKQASDMARWGNTIRERKITVSN